MQTVFKQRIGRHTYNNTDIDGSGIFHSVHIKWLSRRVSSESAAELRSFKLVGSWEDGIESSVAGYSPDSKEVSAGS
jgi:hypothetical protein